MQLYTEAHVVIFLLHFSSATKPSQRARRSRQIPDLGLEPRIIIDHVGISLKLGRHGSAVLRDFLSLLTDS